MIRSKIDWKRKTDQPTTLHPPDPKPWEGIKGWVNPSFRDIGMERIGKKGESGKDTPPKPPVAQRAGGILICECIAMHVYLWTHHVNSTCV